MYLILLKIIAIIVTNSTNVKTFMSLSFLLHGLF